jgi:hypothetical protein
MEAPCKKMQEIFNCKEFCPFFDSLANPAAPISGISATLQQAAGLALAVQCNWALETEIIFDL